MLLTELARLRPKRGNKKKEDEQSINRIQRFHIRISVCRGGGDDQGCPLKTIFFLLRTPLMDHPSVPMRGLRFGLGLCLTLIKTELGPSWWRREYQLQG